VSAETQLWLDQNILTGFTAQRGQAWHRLQGNDNSFEGPVPIERVRELLARYEAEEVKIEYADTGNIIPGVKAIRRIDNGAHYKIFSDGYQPHDYNDWLVDKVGDLLDKVPGDLAIANAGGLMGGAVAFVQMEMPASFKAAMGVEFRPNLTALTSLNGKYKTKYKLMFTNTVCDNSLALGITERSLEVAYKHTSKSLGNLRQVRSDLALGFITDAADAFAAEVEMLGSLPVSDLDWAKFLDLDLALTDDLAPQTRTKREHEREDLNQLYYFDPMVAPWNGSAYGVIQARNTYAQWKAIVRNTERQERNFLNALGGHTEALDVRTREQILSIIG